MLFYDGTAGLFLFLAYIQKEETMEQKDEEKVQKDKFDSEMGKEERDIPDERNENESTGYGIKKRRPSDRQKQDTQSGSGLEEYMDDRPEFQPGENSGDEEK